MAIVHATTAKQAATDAVVDLVDAGTGGGSIFIKTAAELILAGLPLNDPAFGAASTAGTATLDIDPAITATASGTGTAATFCVTDANFAVVFSGVVTLVGLGGDMTLDNTNVVSGQTVTITSFTYDSGEA